MCDLCTAASTARSHAERLDASAAARRARMDDEAVWAAAHPPKVPAWMQPPRILGACPICAGQGGHAPWCHHDRSH